MRIVNRIKASRMLCAIRALYKKLKRFLHSKSSRHYKSLPEWGAGNSGEYLELFRHKKEVCVVGTVFTRYIVNCLASYFKSRGVTCECHYSPIRIYKNNLPYIIISPQCAEKLPAISHYVAFQMEQTVSDRWFTQEYLADLNNAAAVFDYSTINVKKLQEKLVANMFYIPVEYIADYYNETKNKEYDVVFYGDYKSERRTFFLRELAKRFNIKILYEIYGDKLYEELGKAKVAINIHYYENALLETTRIYELLSLGAIVISEKSSDPVEDSRLKDIVDFVEIGDIGAMCERIEYYLNNDKERAQKVTEGRKQLVNCQSIAEKNLDEFFGIVKMSS